MTRLRRCIILLLACVLGFQAAAVAAHTHYLTGPADSVVAAEHHGDDADDAATTSHHGASCVIAQSCFPAAHAAGLPSPVITLTLPPPAMPAGFLPTRHSDPLLRPPRSFA